MLTQNELAHIKYTKKDGTETTRVIIPTFVPNDTIKAIDVSELPREEADQMAEALSDYSAYYQLATSRLFKFEDWLSHTGSPIRDVKWRSFIKDKIEFLDDKTAIAE